MKPNPVRRKGQYQNVYLRSPPMPRVNGGTTPTRVDDVFAYRARARPLDDYFAKLFGMDKHIPGEPRVKALALAERWCTDDYVGMVGVHEHICVKNGNRVKVFLFWTKDRKLYYFIRFNYFTKTAERSVGCSDRTFALNVYNNGLLEWEESVSLI